VSIRRRPFFFSTTAATRVLDNRMSSAEIPSATRTTAGTSSPVTLERRRTTARSGISVSKTLSIRNFRSSSTETSLRSWIVSSLTTRSDSISLESCSAGSRGSVSVGLRSSSAEALRMVLLRASSPAISSMRTRVVDSDSTFKVTPPTVIRSPDFRGCSVTRRSPFKNVPFLEARSSTVRPPLPSRTIRACWRESILSEIGRSFIEERPIVVTGRSSRNFCAGIPGAVT
jgi:hypothetical protein